MTELMGSTIDEWLRELLSELGAAAGTVHVRRGDVLEEVAASNIPEAVRKVTARIPYGKGMAGLAWERRRPVSTCNLQTDSTGDVRPGAKAVGAAAAVALPVFDAAGEVRAVVGVAFMAERDMPDAELDRLMARAASAPV
jgi:hypothetical protein